MKSLFKFFALGVLTLSVLSVEAQHSDMMKVYNLPNSKLHVFQTGDAMGDVSFIIEGKKRVVVLEQPTFYESIEVFNRYVKELDKPIEKVIANYHQGGLAQYKSSKIVMPEPMVEFGKAATYTGMIKHFQKEFGESIDLRPFGKAKCFAVPSTQEWAGVEFKFTHGAESDFPAAAIQIDGEAFYIHFPPSVSHANPMQIQSPKAIDAVLMELQAVKNSGAKYIFGSHGKEAGKEELDFQIEYLTKLKELFESSLTSDKFAVKLIAAYPNLNGVENIKTVAAKLYPNEAKDAEKEALRVAMQNYFDSVSNLNMGLARKVWAENENISIITPRSHFFGFESIKNDFFLKAFSNFKFRKLNSLAESITVDGNSARIELYWIFDTVNDASVKALNRGRESLVFEKISGEWKLMHVHYSHVPKS
jgi:hypothetical protein